MNKWFHPAHYNGCNYFSMLGLKFIHVSKSGPRSSYSLKTKGRQFDIFAITGVNVSYQIDDLWFSVTLPFPCCAISCNIVGYWAMLYRDSVVLLIFPHIINWHIFSGLLFTSWCFRGIFSFKTFCADVHVNCFRFTMSKWKASSQDIYVESPFSETSLGIFS